MMDRENVDLGLFENTVVKAKIVDGSWKGPPLERLPKSSEAVLLEVG